MSEIQDLKDRLERAGVLVKELSPARVAQKCSYCNENYSKVIHGQYEYCIMCAEQILAIGLGITSEAPTEREYREALEETILGADYDEDDLADEERRAEFQMEERWLERG